MKPTDIFTGRHPHVRSPFVRVNLNQPRTSCQALESAHGDRELDEPWRPCPHPPFAIVTDKAASAWLCWRHLYQLGDTGTLRVEPHIEVHYVPAEGGGST